MIDLVGIGAVLGGGAAVWSAVQSTLAKRNTRTPKGVPPLGQLAAKSADAIHDVQANLQGHYARVEGAYAGLAGALHESAASQQDSTVTQRALLRWLEEYEASLRRQGGGS